MRGGVGDEAVVVVALSLEGEGEADDIAPGCGDAEVRMSDCALRRRARWGRDRWCGKCLLAS